MNDYYNYNASRNKAVAGFILLTAGLLFLFKQIGYMVFPLWLFSWPMLLIVIGLYSGFKHNFRRAGWLIVTLVGALFLATHIVGFALSNFVLPVILIACGLKMILSRNRYWGRPGWVNEMRYGAGMEVPID